MFRYWFTSQYVNNRLILVTKYTLKAFYGKWVLRFGRLSFTLLFRRGGVTFNGKVINVRPSKNKRYPFSQGWFIYYYRGWTYYIRRSGRSRIYIFRMNKGGKVVKGKDRFLFTIGKPKLYTLPAQLALSFYFTEMTGDNVSVTCDSRKIFQINSVPY